MIKQYIEDKIKLLKQFRVYLTEEQLHYIDSLETETAVDNYAQSLRSHKYGDENNKFNFIYRY